jgi:hypothetical protein
MKPPYRLGVWSALLFCALLLLSCKTSDDATAAAKQVATTSTDLAGYYSTLSQIAASYTALNELQTSLQGVPLSDADRAILGDTASELKKRADIATDLQGVSTAFSNLTGSTAPTDVSNAASKLASELTTLKPVQLPSASPVPLPSAIGDAAKLILSMVQQHQERKIAPSLDATLKSLNVLFSNEKDLYDSLNKTYLNLAGALAKVCINKNFVDNTSVLAPALQPFSLSARASSATDASLGDAAKTQVDAALTTMVSAHSKASTAMLQAITEMNTRVHQLATEQRMPSRGAPVSLTAVESWINTVSSYLSSGGAGSTSSGSAASATGASKTTKK